MSTSYVMPIYFIQKYLLSTSLTQIITLLFKYGSSCLIDEPLGIVTSLSLFINTLSSADLNTL